MLGRAAGARLLRARGPLVWRQERLLTTGGAPQDRLAVLCILDGWGYNERIKNNAVLTAHTPTFDALWGASAQRGQQAFLNASEKPVGLPPGQIGNSEVGHMNLGAGRRVLQDILAIDEAIDNDELKTKEALVEHIQKLKESGGKCHLMGLVSPGGVHAMQSQMAALANEIQRAGVDVLVHAFTDGRDVPPRDAINTMPDFLKSLDEGVKVATVTGRFYAMDRDNRWERVGAAYDAVMLGKGTAEGCSDAMSAIQASYDRDEGDEFVEPTVIGDFDGVKDGDGIMMCNFRADRAREILAAIADPEPPQEMGFGADRPERPKLADVSGMVQYSDRHKTYMSALFPVKDIQNTIGEVVSRAGLSQLRIAETEKFPHVTFFFSSQDEPFEGEERILCPSPKVRTYDLQPEMATAEISKNLCEALDAGKFNMVICNFACPDMVGHTGSLEAAVKAVEACDAALADILESMRKRKGVLLTTADHGNCDQMWDDEINGPHTAHTLARVPIFLTDFSGEDRQLKIQDGALCDVAPTMLHVLGLEQPAEMTGKSLIVSENA